MRDLKRIPNPDEVPPGSVLLWTDEDDKRRLRMAMAGLTIGSAAAGAGVGYAVGRARRKKNPSKRKRQKNPTPLQWTGIAVGSVAVAALTFVAIDRMLPPAPLPNFAVIPDHASWSEFLDHVATSDPIILMAADFRSSRAANALRSVAIKHPGVSFYWIEKSYARAQDLVLPENFARDFAQPNFAMLTTKAIRNGRSVGSRGDSRSTPEGVTESAERMISTLRGTMVIS